MKFRHGPLAFALALWGVAQICRAEAQTANIRVAVELFPIGSFTITSNEIRGSGTKTGTSFAADELSVAVASLDTGIGLRTTHMQEKLKAKEFPLITARKISAQNDSGKAEITIMGITKALAFSYKELAHNRAEAVFKLTLSDFALRGINYLGVGVQDEVEVTVTLPYKTQ